MKIKLVDFEDIDMDGSIEVDYGLVIGKVYNVVDRGVAMGIKSFDIINSSGKPVTVFEHEVEIQS